MRIGFIEVVGVKEGRVNADRVHPRSACHAHVIERVAEVSRLGWRRRVTKGCEPTPKRCWIGLLFDRVVAVDGRADQVGNTGTAQLPRNDLAIASGDDAEGDPSSHKSL